MIDKFKPTDKVLVLDFDHACYDTDAFLMSEITHRMLRKFNIPVEIWEKSYESAVRLGYSLEQHRSELIKILGYEPYSMEELQAFEAKMNFDKYLYSDVLLFLKEARDKGYKIMLLSFGATDWQNKKVRGVGLDKLVDVIKYTKEARGKMAILKEYIDSSNKVIFVDNNGGDVDEVHKVLPHIETYFMNRVPADAMDAVDDDFLKMRYAESRKIAERHVAFKHKCCHSLTEVVL